MNERASDDLTGHTQRVLSAVARSVEASTVKPGDLIRWRHRTWSVSGRRHVDVPHRAFQLRVEPGNGDACWVTFDPYEMVTVL